MIKTEHGKTHMEGSASDLADDFYCIMKTAFDKVPFILERALATLIHSEGAERMQEDDEDARLEELAAMMSLLPPEELERIKKEMEGD